MDVERCDMVVAARTTRTKRGGASEKGFPASRSRTAGDPFSSRWQNRSTHELPSKRSSAANHICQSRRGWCGATQGGGRRSSPGLYLNS